MTRICPKCKHALVSGFSPLCNFCGAKIPSHLLFSVEEREKIEADERRTKELIDSMEAERIKKAKDAAAEAAVSESFYRATKTEPPFGS